MTRPANYLDWCTTHLGDINFIVAPSAGKKATGWVTNDIVPYEYLNWLFYYTDQWIQYFDSILLAIPMPAYILLTTGNTTINSNQLTSLGSTTNLNAGAPITGTGIPANTYIYSISGSTVTMTKNATVTNTGTSITFNFVYVTGSTVQIAIEQLDNAYSGIINNTVAMNPATQSPYTLTSADNGKVFLVNSLLGASQFNLPAASFGFSFVIKDSGVNCDNNNIVIHRAAAESIEGVASDYTIMAPGVDLQFNCDGTNWYLRR